MADSKWWLVCYDVRDAKRLRKCAKHMEGYGLRIQYSIFRCWMTPTEVARLRWELNEKLDPEDDVLLISLCQRWIGDAFLTMAQDHRIGWMDRGAGCGRDR